MSPHQAIPAEDAMGNRQVKNGYDLVMQTSAEHEDPWVTPIPETKDMEHTSNDSV